MWLSQDGRLACSLPWRFEQLGLKLAHLFPYLLQVFLHSFPFAFVVTIHRAYDHLRIAVYNHTYGPLWLWQDLVLLLGSRIPLHCWSQGSQDEPYT